jgi:hypothetical protein
MNRRRRATLPAGVKLTRVEFAHPILTAYQVTFNGKEIGYVWRQICFSYRGNQGWNRGVRLHDYHPKEWRYGRYVSDGGSYCYARHYGVGELLRQELLPG